MSDSLHSPSSSPPASMHPHDVGLPLPVVRKRRHARHVAHWMLIIAAITALGGWLLYGNSVMSAIRITDDQPAQTILAYVLLMISSVTLILGLWFLLLAQVRRIARMEEGGDEDGSELETIPALKCPNCGWTRDEPDRFCRHCGKNLTG